MFDEMFGTNDYPLNALWIERNSANTIDDTITYEGAVPFKYRNVKSTAQKEQLTNGLKGVTYDKTIRTNVDITFKAKDKIKIGSKVYTIQTANEVENDLYKNARIIYTHFIDYETELVLR